MKESFKDGWCSCAFIGSFFMTLALLLTFKLEGDIWQAYSLQRLFATDYYQRTTPAGAGNAGVNQKVPSAANDTVKQDAESPHANAIEKQAAPSKRKNVLFIIADDMRPELGAYDGDLSPSRVHPKMHTPNLDELAQRSTLFSKAYVQFPLCGPSRASFLTSRRPDTLHQYSFDSFRATGGLNVTTLPQYFKQQGYKSIGIGKIFDPPYDGKNHISEDKWSFSERWIDESNYHYWTHEVKTRSWQAVTPDAEKRRPLPDNQVLDRAIKRLKKLASPEEAGDQPFFMAVGFFKPHCPYIFPEKYLQYYPEEEIKLPENPYVPSHFPEEAWHNYRNLRRFDDTKVFPATYNTTLPDKLSLELRRAYYAAITYVDDLIGQLLQELYRQGFGKDTVVCFIGDHGYHLGENGEWTKQTLFELSARAPLMLHIPGVTDQGRQEDHFVEFVDIFPTLAEAAGVPPLPLCPQNKSIDVSLCTEGTSFLPLVKGGVISWKERVFTLQGRYYYRVLGWSMRTPRYRYTEWRNMDRPFKTVAVELYDHEVDPLENHNIADEQSSQEVRKELCEQLKAYWRAALPANS